MNERPGTCFYVALLGLALTVSGCSGKKGSAGALTGDWMEGVWGYDEDAMLRKLPMAQRASAPPVTEAESKILTLGPEGSGTFAGWNIRWVIQDDSIIFAEIVDRTPLANRVTIQGALSKAGNHVLVFAVDLSRARLVQISQSERTHVLVTLPMKRWEAKARL